MWHCGLPVDDIFDGDIGFVELVIDIYMILVAEMACCIIPDCRADKGGQYEREYSCRRQDLEALVSFLSTMGLAILRGNGHDDHIRSE